MFNFKNLFSNEDEDKKNIIDIVTGIAGASIPGKNNNNSTSENSSSVFDNIRNMFSENNTSMDDHEALYNEIMNREPFEYDVNGDALYQQYKDNYIQQGKMAMEDAMGQMSSLTGGYASSAAMSAGQQAYQGELSKINEVVPDLYQNALNKYMMEGEDLYNQYAMAYGQYRDDIEDKRYEDEVAYKKEQDALTRAETNAANFYTSGGKVGYDNGSLTPDQVTKLTNALGLSTNGQWNSAALKATRMTADEAWAHYQDTLSRGESFYYSTVANDIDTFIELGSMTRKELYAYLDKAQKEGLITMDEAAALHEVVKDKVDEEPSASVKEVIKIIEDNIYKIPGDADKKTVAEYFIEQAYADGEITKDEKEKLLKKYGIV